MKKYQDIQTTDAQLYSQFVQYWLDGQYSNAFAIIDNNPQLDTKAFQATCFNLIAQAIVAVENFGTYDVEEFLAIELTRFNTGINNFKQLGTFIFGYPYVVGNFVMYNNLIYLCIKDSTGNLPTDTTYWVLIGLRGEIGATGIDVTMKYQWNGAATYNARDLVYYDGYLWMAISTNTNQVPSTTSAYWEVFLQIPKIKIIVSTTAPSNPYDGLIWWQVLSTLNI